VLGAFEGEGEGRKLLLRTEPDEAALAHVDVWFEPVRMERALLTVHAVRGDDQIGVRQVLHRSADLVLEVLLDAERRRAILKYVQKALSGDAAEPVTPLRTRCPRKCTSTSSQ